MNEKPSTAKIALKWGGITGVVLIIFSTVIYVSGSTGNTLIGSLAYIIVAVGLVLAMRAFKQLDGGYLGYGDGLGLGTLTSAVAGLISTLYSTIYTTLIDPGIIKRVTDQLRDQYEEQGIDDAQIDRIVEITNSLQSPGISLVTGVLGGILIGFIFSLVIAAVMRRNKPVFE